MSHPALLKKQPKGRKLFSLWLHDNNFAAEDLIINPDIFPEGTHVGDVVEIFKLSNPDKKLLLRVGGFNKNKGDDLYVPLML